jgi:hypothetical protein
MKLDAVGRIGEVCNEANVPTLAKAERIIGFRQLRYTVFAGSLLRRILVDERTGWVYQTNERIVMLDDGEVPMDDGSRGKRYHQIPFDDVQDVRWKRREVRIPVADDAVRATVAFRPFGAAARLFDWLKREKEKRRAVAKGTAESPYAKVREAQKKR